METEVIDHKQGTTIRIRRTWPDFPDGWEFEAAIRLPDGSSVPLEISVVDPREVVRPGESLPPGCIVYLSLVASAAANLPARLLAVDFKGSLNGVPHIAPGEEVAAQGTFYININPDFALSQGVV